MTKKDTLKLLLAAIILALFPLLATAQTPDFFSYQSIVCNDSKAPIENTMITLKISIIKDQANGEIVYTETHQPTTDNNGLIAIEIGNGQSEDDFSAIDWGTNTYFIQSDMDLNNDNNYTLTGTHRLLSVPYALHAKNAVPKEYIDHLVDSLSQLITALNEYNTPEADFTSTSQTVAPNAPVYFTSTSSNKPTSYLWHFSGGNPEISNESNPSVEFAAYGTHTAKLVVQNRFGKDSVIKEDYIFVPEAPVANFTASETSIEPGTTITFTSTSSQNPTSYLWNFGVGSPSTSTSASPSVLFSTQGSYTISLTVSNVTGSDTETKVNYIWSNDLP